MRRLAPKVPAALLITTLCALAGAQTGGRRAVAAGGVSFYYARALASDVKAEVAPASQCGKPGDVTPPHAAFTLADYPAPHESPFMRPPEIQVFPVAEYRRALAACEREMAAVTRPPVSHYVTDFDDQVRTLKALLARKGTRRDIGSVLNARARGAYRGRMPFLPMYDVSEALRAHVSYVEFRNGRGVAFVTQFTIEDTVISNQALAYVFQGLTDDGEFYVSAAFPVGAPFLPADFGDEVARREGLDYRSGMNSPTFRRNYKRHLARAARRLEALAPARFRPALGLLDELVRSLHVNRDLLKSSLKL